TFIPEEALAMPGYQLFASPTLYSGQTVTAQVTNIGSSAALVGLAIRIYNSADTSEVISADAQEIAAGDSATLTWTVPDTAGMPIHAVGFEVRGGSVAVDSLTWSGTPTVTFARPQNRDALLWRRQFVDAVDHFEARFFEAFRISNNAGRGIMSVGTRDWTDYTVTSEIMPYLAKNVGVAARIGGLRRYIALLLGNDGRLRLIELDDERETVLAEAECPWEVFQPVTFELTVQGDQATGRANGVELTASIAGTRLTAGGAGFVIEEGTMGSEAITIRP
ncbi:MAG: hypothetical protein M3Y37_07150, partial [Chloroflexota bacterium]|nr:hypothetical protein [Chloroflexota bacterium]